VIFFIISFAVFFPKGMFYLIKYIDENKMSKNLNSQSEHIVNIN